ncbi:MAG: hypothetical protein ACK2UO_21910, partial [Caldilineaceae bacterium]
MSQLDTTSSPAPQPYYDDEIDLSQYLDVLIAWWKEILLIAFATAALAVAALLVLDSLSAPAYTASADVVIARLASEITLDERVQTVMEDSGSGTTTDSHRAALVALGHSGEIAGSVADELGDLLSEQQRDPSTLLKMVEVSLPTAQDNRTPSNLIRVEATADSPELASMIANSWAQQFVQKVNTVYGQVPPDVLDSLRTELSSADDSYQEAQRNLEAFTAESQVDTLSRQITEQQDMRTALQTGRSDALALLVNEDQSARRELLQALTTAQLDAHLDVFSEQVQARTADLSQLYTARNATQQQLDQARNLQEQIAAGGDAAVNTNAIALQLLKAQVFASIQSPVLAPVQIQGEAPQNAQIGTESRLPADLQLNVDASSPASAEEQQQDVTALVDMLEQYLQDLDGRISEASQALLSGEGYAFLDTLDAGSLGITGNVAAGSEVGGAVGSDGEADSSTVDSAILRNYEALFDLGSLLALSQAGALEGTDGAQQKQMLQLDQSIQRLRSRLAAEQSREKYLTQQRDLAWNTFDALSNKAAQMRMELSAANRQVRMGSFAIPPNEPIEGRSIVMMGGLAFAFGLLLGVFVAFLSNYQGRQPFLSRKPQPA